MVRIFCLKIGCCYLLRFGVKLMYEDIVCVVDLFGIYI